MSKAFPDFNTLLQSMGQAPWVEPETKSDATLRLLTVLSDAPSWKWAKQHWQVKRWYDKCYEQLHKTGELFTYPVQREQVLNHKAFFESVVQANPLLTRACVLLLAEPNLTGDRVYEILKLEGYRPKLAGCRVMVRSMQVLIGLMSIHQLVDLKALYPPKEGVPTDG